MNYFTIRGSHNTDEIGFYPQTNLSEDYNPTLPTSHRKVVWNEFPLFEPVYGLTLNPKAIPTDFLAAIDLTTGWIVSSKFKSILETCVLPPHRFYRVKVEQRGIELDYFWFHFISGIYKYIDMSNSSVAVFHRVSKVTEIIKMGSLENLKEIKSKLSFEQGLRYNEVFLNEDFPGYDVFELTDIQFIPVVSETLLNKLRAAKLTGFEFASFDKIK